MPKEMTQSINLVVGNLIVLFRHFNGDFLSRRQTFFYHWEKIEKRFSIFEFRLGINFFHFRLRSFEEVGERLGSPVAGVEIDTG